ncbi:hypothetical protein K9U33_20305, partial [Rhodoblastus acidophilus]|uniref:hypothetical protein n=1 Tax=Candidatus Rhodoblastus alkanivorans TaxID=2954117 RepID=UPI001FAA4FAE
MAAKANKRRACAASFARLAATRMERASKSARRAIGMANLLVRLLNQINAGLGIARRVRVSGTWY